MDAGFPGFEGSREPLLAVEALAEGCGFGAFDAVVVVAGLAGGFMAEGAGTGRAVATGATGAFEGRALDAGNAELPGAVLEDVVLDEAGAPVAPGTADAAGASVAPAELDAPGAPVAGTGEGSTEAASGSTEAGAAGAEPLRSFEALPIHRPAASRHAAPAGTPMRRSRRAGTAGRARRGPPGGADSRASSFGVESASVTAVPVVEAKSRGSEGRSAARSSAGSTRRTPLVACSRGAVAAAAIGTATSREPAETAAEVGSGDGARNGRAETEGGAPVHMIGTVPVLPSPTGRASLSM